jgi:hypothetical protein
MPSRYQSSADHGAMFVAIAAACMARGLLPEQADMVFEKVKLWPIPLSAGEAMHDLDRAINEVRSEPTPH